LPPRNAHDIIQQNSHSNTNHNRWFIQPQEPLTTAETHPFTLSSLGRIAPTSFMISVQRNLDQKLNQVHTVLRCTKLNSVSRSRSVERPWLHQGQLWLVNHARPTGQLQWRHSHIQCLRNSPVQIGCNSFKF